MKRYLIPILVILALASGLVVGCGQNPKPTTKADNPTLGSEEVRALVYNYLEARGSAMTLLAPRLRLLEFLNKAVPYFTASYQGNGKWQVSAVGNDGVGRIGNFSGGWGGLWNVYENSGVIEPANDKARELLNYIQWCTR